MEINCSGPFRFDVVGRVATFRDRVDVMKANPSGPSDQITCDVLSLYFAERSKEKPDPKAAGSLDLVAQRIEAQGNPVVVTAPSQKEHGGVVTARGPRLQYDLQAGSITLDGGQEVFLQQAANEIHARSLYYQSAGPGRLGRMEAQGPGWLRGRSADRPDQQLEAVWKDKLRVEPDKQEQRISFSGGAELNFPGVGQLQAREILLWIAERPQAAANQPSDLRPNRMSARDDVHLNSPQLSAKVQQLEVWFEETRDEGQGEGAVVEKSPGTAVPASPAGRPLNRHPNRTTTRVALGWQFNCHPNRTFNRHPNQHPCNGTRSSADCSVPGYCWASSRPASPTFRSKTASISWKRKAPSPTSSRCGSAAIGWMRSTCPRPAPP